MAVKEKQETDRPFICYGDVFDQGDVQAAMKVMIEMGTFRAFDIKDVLYHRRGFIGKRSRALCADGTYKILARLKGEGLIRRVYSTWFATWAWQGESVMSGELCCICDKPLGVNHEFVNVDNRTGKVISPRAKPTHGDFGALGIGRDCAKRLSKEGTIKKGWLIPRTPSVYTIALGFNLLKIIDDHRAVVYEVHPDELAMLIEDGHMKNGDDLKGLAKWLSDQGYVRKNAKLKLRD